MSKLDTNSTVSALAAAIQDEAYTKIVMARDRYKGEWRVLVRDRDLGEVQIQNADPVLALVNAVNQMLALREEAARAKFKSMIADLQEGTKEEEVPQ